jgi:hypothetical protein
MRPSNSAGMLLPSFPISSCGAIAADAATTSAFPTLEFATVDADQRPNAVAAAMPPKTTKILHIVCSLRPVGSTSTSHRTHPPPVMAVTSWRISSSTTATIIALPFPFRHCRWAANIHIVGGRNSLPPQESPIGLGDSPLPHCSWLGTRIQNDSGLPQGPADPGASD